MGALLTDSHHIRLFRSIVRNFHLLFAESIPVHPLDPSNLGKLVGWQDPHLLAFDLVEYPEGGAVFT
jgi:hypothetical protein